PAILLANDLLDGDVVFWTPAGWSRDSTLSLIARDEEGARELERIGLEGFARSEVVDAYLVDVELDGKGHPMPRHFRERTKLLGPSHRPDLDKRAPHLRSAV